jgi:phosphoserine phosphatase
MVFFAQGENKALAVRELCEQRGIDLADCFAYSDSETDVPMLRQVGHAYAVNPDRQLAKVAHECEWPILSFTHPVRAHDRSRSHTPFIISAIVFSVAAVLGRMRMRRI